MTERQKELIALDRHAPADEIRFDTLSENLVNVLWIQVKGVRYYNLGYKHTSDDTTVYGIGEDGTPCPVEVTA